MTTIIPTTLDLRQIARTLFAAHEDRLTRQIEIARAELAAAELEGDEPAMIAAQVKMTLDLAARQQCRAHLTPSTLAG